MSKPFTIHSALNYDIREVQFRPIYTCHKCGARGVGDGTVTESSLPAPDYLPPPAYMPVGWSANGRTRYTCPRCLT